MCVSVCLCIDGHGLSSELLLIFIVPFHDCPFFPLQVLFTGFSYGGLSELPESDYISCSMGSTIAGEIGMFGYKPSMLMDMLAGKRVEVSARLGPYMRTFSCDCSPTDLETALQVCLLPPAHERLFSKFFQVHLRLVTNIFG